MPPSLSSKDVARLMAEPSGDARAELAGKLSADLSGRALTEAEVRLGQEIVRILARDVEVEVRAALARGLRHSPHLPADVARRLAADVEYVALPVLADSLILTDDDLIEIVRNGTGLKQEAVASRPNLPESVADAVIAHGAEPAVVALMSNNTAQISGEGFNRAMERFQDSDPVKQAMVLRDRLPPAVAERLVNMVSKALQAHLVKTHELAPGTAADIVLASREQAIIHLSAGASDTDLHQMVEQMNRNGRLTPSLLLRALCTGDIAFFEAALAVRGDVSVDNAQILIHEPGRRGLEALYRKARMPDGLYGAVKAAVDVIDETAFDGSPNDLARFRSRVITRVLTSLEAADTPDTAYLIEKLGQVLVQTTHPAE